MQQFFPKVNSNVIKIGLAVLGAVALCKTISYIKDRRKRILLELSLEHKSFVWESVNPLTALFNPETLSIRDIVDSLDIASEDNRILGIIIRIGGTPIPAAFAQEIRNAIIRFKSKGKEVICYGDTLGEAHPAQINYYIASACNKIYVAESGDVNLVGLFVSHPFLRKTLDKIGIEPQIYQREEYKNMANLFMKDRFTEGHKEAVEGMISGIFDVILKDISQDRSIPIEQLKKIFADGPYTAKSALAANLIDGLLYRDQVYKQTKERLKSTDLMFLHQYLQKSSKKRPFTKGKNVIAYINAEGPVHRGNSESSGIFSSSENRTIGSDTICANFRAATADSKVKAIIFRVDSGGGSYVASDAIAREVQVAREAGKKVIVYMGNVAASGGYFVSLNADKIVCQPLTFTGSIGIVFGKMVLTGLADKLGVTFGHIEQEEEHQSGRLYSAVVKYNEQEEKRVNNIIDTYYEDFKSKVANGRKLEKSVVDSIAKGRVWLGHQAHSNRLVDQLGDFRSAVELAAKECEIDIKTVKLEKYPKKASFLSRLSKPLSSEDADKKGIPAGSSFVSIARAVASFNQIVSMMSAAISVLGHAGITESNLLCARNSPAAVAPNAHVNSQIFGGSI